MHAAPTQSLAGVRRARALAEACAPDASTGERLEALATKLRVARIVHKRMHAAGSVTRESDGTFEICVSEELGHTRRNFTVAHELAHIILEPILPHMRNVRPTHRSIGSSRYDEIERIVDSMAAELLMPEAIFTDALREACIAQRNKSAVRIRYWDVVRVLRQRFEVSEMALVLRLLEIEGIDAVNIRLPRDPALQWNSRGIRVRKSSGTRVIPSSGRPKSAAAFLEQCEDGNFHHVLLHRSGKTRVVQCQVRSRYQCSARERFPVYSILGWTWRMNPIPYYDDAR